MKVKMLEVDSNNPDVNDGRGYIPEVKSAIDVGIEGMGGAAGEVHFVECFSGGSSSEYRRHSIERERERERETG